MSYIGATPLIGNYQKCDAITTSATDTFNLLVGGVAVSPATPQNCIVSLNGVIQAPTTAYTIVAATIVFDSALTTDDVIDFIVILGNVLDLGTPSDDTVTAAKLNDTVISGQTALGEAPADTDEFLVSDAGVLKRLDYSYIKGGGKIGQVVQTVNTGTETLSSTTPTTISDFTVAITPAATSSKVLVMVNAIITVNNNNSMGLQLFRDTTQIFMGDAASSRARSSWTIYANVDRQMWPTALCYLDSPSSTSAIDYSCKWFSQGSAAAYMNRSALDSDNATYDQRTASSITVMEILA